MKEENIKSEYQRKVDKSFFLDYAQEKPRIAFCTSIGMTEFPIKDKEILLRLIKKYSFISVREKSAELLLKKYGISAYTAMDPTLLIEGCFWKKMATKRSVARPYLLVYQLHYDKHQGVRDQSTVELVEKLLNKKTKLWTTQFMMQLRQVLTTWYLLSVRILRKSSKR